MDGAGGGASPRPRLEDPCPFWDSNGKAYLVHSRVGAGPLILHRMSPDGRRVLDAGKVIVEDPVNLPVLEGPKLLKRNGWYYIFAPYGGVEKGPQAVLRSKNIYGPYEVRTVLAQGNTAVQAPHQGGYVETPKGEGWFVHFNSTGAYGRIVHLQPVRWVDDWPLMGEPIAGSTTTGQPVMSHAMPDVGRSWPEVTIQTLDKFDGEKLAVQWEWNHNPLDAKWSLATNPGFMRLRAVPATDFLAARNTLTQVLHGPTSRDHHAHGSRRHARRAARRARHVAGAAQLDRGGADRGRETPHLVFGRCASHGPGGRRPLSRDAAERVQRDRHIRIQSRWRQDVHAAG